LAVSNGKGGLLLAGITSWGIGCADGYDVGIYTRVSSFYQWINRMLTTVQATAVGTAAIVLDTISLGTWSVRKYKVLVPRGLKAAHFRLIYRLNGSTNDRAELLIKFEKPDHDCVSWATPKAERCSFISPLEGLYNIQVSTYSRSITQAVLQITYESLKAVQSMSFTVNGQTIQANEKIYFLAFPTIPGTRFQASITASQAQLPSPRLQLKDGYEVFSLASGPYPTEIDQSTTSTATSIVVIGDYSTSSQFDLAISYKSLWNIPTSFVTLDYSLRNTWNYQKYPINVKLQVGSELGIRIYLIYGNIEVFALAGGTITVWSCKPGAGKVSFCNGIIPQENPDTIVVQVKVYYKSSFDIRIIYDPA
jgi:hypothetical protein